jgi:peptide/nickel transport system permease protein
MTIRRAAIVSAIVGAHVVVFAAPWIAPYEPAEQHRDAPYAPPMRLHLVDRMGAWHAGPFVCGLTHLPGNYAAYAEDCTTEYPIRWFVRREARVGVTLRSRIHLATVEPPGRLFLLGTDSFGRDELSRLLVGAQTSVSAAAAATALALAIGILFGAMAGYFRGPVDGVVSALGELLLALPWLYLLLAVRAALPLSLAPLKAYGTIMLVLGLAGWPRPARLIRALVVTARGHDYVTAARAAGASSPYVLRRHMLPVVWGIAGVQALVLVPQFVLAEATLSLFGLGVAEPLPSWGTMLADAMRPVAMTNAWWLLSPVAGLILFCVMYYALAQALRAAPVPPLL